MNGDVQQIEREHTKPLRENTKRLDGGQRKATFEVREMTLRAELAFVGELFEGQPRFPPKVAYPPADLGGIRMRFPAAGHVRQTVPRRPSEIVCRDKPWAYARVERLSGFCGEAMNDDGFEALLAQARERVGTTFKDKWRLERLLGVGGMACVYEASHRNRKRAALKLLHRELSMNPAIRARFLREGYVANSVGHPGAVVVDDDDVTEDGCAFLVMELLEGETLDARWERKNKRLPVDEVLSLMDQVLSTLTAAHAAGIVHRDLKPENLFLTRAGIVKILDFGIARVREVSQSSKTQTGSMMGTPSFMPPEQARGRWEEVDAQSDLWAVGATMFTLLSGQYVHDAGTVNEALAFAVTRPARSVAALLPELPFPCVELVDRALAYDKPDRWPSAATMQTALRRAYAGLEAAAREAGEPALKPITLETFEDATVALAEAAIRPQTATPQLGLPAIDSDLPPGQLPVVKRGALTTARGVARGVLTSALRYDRRVTIGVVGVTTTAAAIGIWLGIDRGGPASESPSRESTTQPDPSSAPVVAEASAGTTAASAGLSPVPLEQLPIDRATATVEAEPLVPRLRAELDKARAAPSTSPLASGRREPAAPAAKPRATFNPNDPFSSRR